MVLIEKHFTSTAFVLHPIEDKFLLHWHSKVKAWLPPGGHIENNETPVEAVKRETFEETGIHIKLYNFNSSMSEIPFSDVKEIPAPYTILLENINDPEIVKSYAKEKEINFAIIGPENPLANGIVDSLLDIGIHSIGPKKELAQIETSKSFTSKEFLAEI